jgi:transcriptional regulator with XRE-family HTH domain
MVTNDSQTGVGAQIRVRRARLGMPINALAEMAGIDRGRLAALEAGDTKVQDRTKGAVLAALDRIEDEMGYGPAPLGDRADFVEFVIDGASGSRAVVKVPIRDVAALQAAVQGIITGLRTNP